MHEKYQYYNGLKFTRDEETGYYLNSTLRIRMHRYVWVCEKGDIPEGYDVHHIDHDKGNNDISNLELLTKKEHRKKHFEEMPEEDKQRYKDNMNKNARPAAIEWHKSDEGRKWHSEHMKKLQAQGVYSKKDKFICEVCGKEFERIARKGHKFCSGACQQKYIREKAKRESGTKEIICSVCGKKFIMPGNSIAKTCSRSCGNVLRGQTLKERKGN